jgi:hypothetical protein
VDRRLQSDVFHSDSSPKRPASPAAAKSNVPSVEKPTLFTFPAIPDSVFKRTGLPNVELPEPGEVR